MNMLDTLRSRPVLWILPALLGGALAYECWSLIVAPLQERQAKLVALEEQRLQQQQKLSARSLQAAKLKSWTSISLPLDEKTAAAAYYPYLTELAQRCGLTQVSITPTSSDTKLRDARWWGLNLYANATREAWSDFLDQFQATGILHRIANFDLQDASNSELRGNVSIEVACIGADREWDFDAHELPDPRKSLFASRAWFSDRSQPAAVPAPPPPPAALVNDADTTPRLSTESFVLIGTLIFSDRQEAWWYETNTKRNCIVRNKDPFELGDVRGTIAEIDARGVTLRIDGRELRINLGQSLSNARS